MAPTIRPIEPGDRERLRRGFERLSPDSRYRRFLSPKLRLTDTELTRLSVVDHSDHEALMALDEEQETAIGVARYVRSRDDATAAEVSVAVVDDWQGQGVGRMLLERLADRARQEGIERFTALVLAENRPAQQLLAQLGPVARQGRGSEIELEIALPERGLGDSLRSALRAAAHGAFGARPLVEGLSRLAHDAYAGRTVLNPATAVGGGPVVVGTDGSEPAQRAVRVAAGLAESLGVSLHVVSVHRRRADHQRAEALACAATEPLGDGADVRTHARQGDPGEVLLDVAAEVGAGLLVVGDRGEAHRSRFLLGGLAAKVAHHAEGNLLIVRGD